MGQTCCGLAPPYGELGYEKQVEPAKVHDSPNIASLGREKEFTGLSSLPILVHNYVSIGKLGKGAFSIVKKARHQLSNQEYVRSFPYLHPLRFQAVKILNKSFLRKRKPGSTDETLYEKVQREIALLHRLNHPNVIKLVEAIDPPTGPKLFLGLLMFPYSISFLLCSV